MSIAHTYFTQVPNFIDFCPLPPRAVRLYLHLLRSCGAYGKYRDESLNYLAAATGMTKGTVVRAKIDLVNAGLIRIEKVSYPGGKLDRIYLMDPWSVNWYFRRNELSELPDSPLVITARIAFEKKSKLNKQKTGRPVRLPDDFKITKEMEYWAQRNVPCFNIYRETDRFLDNMAGELRKSWEDAWRGWMRAAAEKQQRRRDGTN